MALTTCPDCQTQISTEAVACPKCGRPMKKLPRERWSRGVAALLSFLIPGAGSIYKGDVALGVVWFVITALGYVVFIVPGLVLHLIGIGIAASGDPTAPDDAPAAGQAVPMRAPAKPRELTVEQIAMMRRRSRIVGAIIASLAVVCIAAFVVALIVQGRQREEASAAGDRLRARAQRRDEELKVMKQEAEPLRLAILKAKHSCVSVISLEAKERSKYVSCIFGERYRVQVDKMGKLLRIEKLQ